MRMEKCSLQAGRLGLGVLVMVVVGAVGAFAQVQTPLPGSAIPQFVDALPRSGCDRGGPAPDQLTVEMKEFASPVLSTGTLVPGVAPLTWVWGYLRPAGQPPSGRPTSGR